MLEQENPGTEVYMADGKSDPSVQINLVENAIADGYDAIVIDPFEGATLSPALSQAMEAGLKVFVISKETEEYDCFANLSQYGFGYQCGQMAAEYALEHFENGACKVGIVDLPTMVLHNEREQGILDAIKEYAPNMEVVATAAGSEGAEQGMSAAENMLQSNPDIQMFICTNDEGAMGVLEAVKSNGKVSDDFAIIGIGGVEQALSELEKDSSYFKGTVTLLPERIQNFLKITLYLARGGELEDPVYVVDGGVSTWASNIDEVRDRLNNADVVTDEHLIYAK